MKKKNLKKLLMAVCCAALLVCVSIGATVAYLTSNDKVTNTFTIGKVKIELDEAKTNVYGVKEYDKDGKEIPVKGNEYKLMPGRTYDKNPTVHVEKGSENSWIFVKVENGITTYEAETSTVEGGYKNIAAQILANGWTKLDSEKDAEVYYRSYAMDAAKNVDYKVFEKFKIADEANEVAGWDKIGTDDTTKVVVTAYAIQADGFEKADDAWKAVKDTATTTQTDTQTETQL